MSNVDRSEAIFREARTKTGDERDRYVRDVCGDDDALRSKVEAMLQADDRASNFRSGTSPTLESHEELRAGGHQGSEHDNAGANDATEFTAEVSERPGANIGPYKLLHLIGEGGFGSVFLAEQEHPVRRRVALKVIKLGMDTRHVVARFEQERQALAMMDHPGIAKVFDAGATDTGRPYFVMELCKGQPITEYCDRHNLSIPDRLALLVQVCQAVQHAHQKGLIHRDLKPSNVLVADQDNKPNVKVIDFGIAKATSSKLTEKTLFTQHNQLVGTPEYMSPEQAEGSLDIDTRTDVYALGVLLYELLTGATPFDGKKLRSAAYAEIQRIIREDDPPKPSTRLSQDTEKAASVAAQRHTEPKKLGTIVRGELDWIVMKALEKDRSRRYETANGLGMDLLRYLAGEPVMAAPPSRVYRSRKFIKRNKGPVLTAALVAVALVVGLIGTAIGLRQAMRARDGEALAKVAAQREADRAIIAEVQAKSRADDLKMVSDFQAEMLKQVDPTAAGVKLTDDVRTRFAAALEKSAMPADQRASQVEAFSGQWSRINATDVSRDLIDATILQPAVAAVEKQFIDQPIVAASLQTVLAERYHDLGLDETALALEQRSLSLRRRALGEDHPDTLTSMNNVGAYLSSLGRTKEAEQYYRDALEKSRRVRGNDDRETFTCIANMGIHLRSQGKFAEAEPFYREAMEGRRRVLGELDPDTLRSMNDWAMLLGDRGKLSESVAVSREVLEKRKRVLGAEHYSTLTTMNDLATMLKNEGKLDEAIACFRDVVEKRRRTLGEVHPVTLTVTQNLGSTLSAAGHPDEAEALVREALTKQQRLLGPDHNSTMTTMGNLCTLLIEQGKFAEAEPLCRETLERRRRVLGETHTSTLIANNVMGLVLVRQNKNAEGEVYWREALSISRRTLGAAHPETLVYTQNLARLMLDEKKNDEAEKLFREVVQNGLPSLGHGHPAVLAATRNLASLLLDAQRNKEVIELLIPAEPFARKAYTGANERQLATFLTTLGRAQHRTGASAAAETLLLEANDIFVRVRGASANDNDLRRSADLLVKFYTAWDKTDPGKGHDASAAKWKAVFAQLEAASRPSSKPAAASTQPSS